MKRIICIIVAAVLVSVMMVTAVAEGTSTKKLSDTMFDTLSDLLEQYDDMRNDAFRDYYMELLYKVYKVYVAHLSLESSQSTITLIVNAPEVLSEDMVELGRGMNATHRKMEADVDAAWDRYLSGEISMDDFDAVLAPIVKKWVEVKSRTE